MIAMYRFPVLNHLRGIDIGMKGKTITLEIVFP